MSKGILIQTSLKFSAKIIKLQKFLIKQKKVKYDKPEMYKKFDNQLKELDEEYKTTIINFNKYPTITFAMAKIMEMSKEEQNQVSLYLFNSCLK